VRLKSGRRIDCDALIFAIGTTPNVELAKAAGIKCQRGVVVSEYMQTSDPSVFAVGEIAEWDGKLFGFTAAAEQQAEVMARYLNGDITSVYRGSTAMNIIKIHGFDLCSMGMADRPNEEEYEEIVFIDRARRYYKKCIVHQDRLVGAILIGDKEEFIEYKGLISDRLELSEKRLKLLRSGGRSEPVIGRLVCSCNNVGSGNIEARISAGCGELQALCAATGAGMGCGSCRPEVKKILEANYVS
jgi:ferredoxin-nitrate reductase